MRAATIGDAIDEAVPAGWLRSYGATIFADDRAGVILQLGDDEQVAKVAAARGVEPVAHEYNGRAWVEAVWEASGVKWTAMGPHRGAP